MTRYETLILIKPDTSVEDIDKIESQFESMVTKSKGVLKSVDRWGKYRLAYPIQKSHYGIYTLIRYELPAESAMAMQAETMSFFRIKVNELVMRHVTKKLDRGFVAYAKPESLDASMSQIAQEANDQGSDSDMA